MSRRKPRLFSFAREVELSYFPDVGPGTAAWNVLSAAVDAFAAISEDRALTPERGEAILAAATHPNPSVCGLGAGRLAVLAHYFPEVAPVFGELVVHPSLQVRLYATTALANAPSDVARAWIGRALADGEWQVRKAAAQVAATIPLPGILPDLRLARENERDARVRVALQLAEDHQARFGAQTLVDDE